MARAAQSSLATVAVLLLLSLILGADTPTFGAIATSTFTVTAAVINVCTITSTSLAFGNYNPLSATDTTGSSTVTVTCTLAAPWSVDLDAGSNPSGTSPNLQRRMALLTSFLGYNLCQDAACAQKWGTTTGGTAVTGTGTGLPQAQTVFGRIPAGQNVSAGAVADSVTATVTF